MDVAIVGIGELEPSQLLKNSGNYYNETMLQLLAARGAVGDICLHYYDAAGKPVLSQDEDPVIGMELEQIRRCPQVIALAGGTPQEGWVEQSAELLLAASLEVISRTVAAVGEERVAALAISNQRETVVGWYRP